MANENTQFIIPGLVAGSDLSAKQHHFAVLTGAMIVDAAPADAEAIGILQGKATAGQPASVAESGTSKLVIGAAVNAGDRLKPDAASRGIAAAATEKYSAIALESGTAAGQIITVLLRRGVA